jgi:hypothetical protein
MQLTLCVWHASPPRNTRSSRVYRSDMPWPMGYIEYHTTLSHSIVYGRSILFAAVITSASVADFLGSKSGSEDEAS